MGMACVNVMILFLTLCCTGGMAWDNLLTPSGFSVELIPPHSPKSPFFNVSPPSYSYLNAVTPPIHRLKNPSGVAVEAGFGTFPNQSPKHKSYFLTLDTGSDLTWLQCEDCKKKGGKCFKQDREVYPNSKSTTYSRLRCNQHPLCTHGSCTDGYCSYEKNYADGAHSKGILSQDALTFPSTSSPSGETLPNIVFGCGSDNADPFAKSDKYQVSGVFGMGDGALSFVAQIKQHRFSYCLGPVEKNSVTPPPPTYLRFGSDIRPPSNLQKTPFYKVTGKGGTYFVKLEDVGINGNRLHVTAALAKHDECAVDSGSALSYLWKSAHDKLVDGLKAHVSNLPGFKVNFRNGGLCYRRTWKKNDPFPNNLPHVNWFFQGGARLDLLPQYLYERFVDVRKRTDDYCLRIEPDSEINSALGADLQADIKFIFDTQKRELEFGPANCARDGLFADTHVKYE